MRLNHCLISVAEYELNALLEDTRSAIEGLRRQRQSVMEAIQAAQQANESTEDAPDEAAEVLTGLMDRLHRLNAVLEWTMCEAEGIRAIGISSGAQPAIFWPLLLAAALPDDHPLVEINSRK